MSAAEIDHRPDTEAALALARERAEESWTDGTDEPASVEDRLAAIEREIARLGTDHGLMGDAIDRIETYARQAVEAIEAATQALPAMLGGGGGMAGMLGGLLGGRRRDPETVEPSWSDAWGDEPDDDGGR